MKVTSDPTYSSSAIFITHAGIFHADEVFATVILSKVFGNNITVLRTFCVSKNIRPDAIVYDIGNGKFDHHQKNGNGIRDNEVPYAACGLIWEEFGHIIVRNSYNPRLVWELMDRDLIQGIDASDNGVKFRANFGLAKIISDFNPSWNSSDDPDVAFLKAVEFATIIFDNALKNACTKAEAKNIVESAIQNSKDNIMILEYFVPWADFLFNSANPKAQQILFVVFPSIRGGYNWQCVTDNLGSYCHRKHIPEHWKGLNGAELQKVTGVATATFCHPGGFIGGAKTLEDTIKLAEIAVNS